MGAVDGLAAAVVAVNAPLDQAGRVAERFTAPSLTRKVAFAWDMRGAF